MLLAAFIVCALIALIVGLVVGLRYPHGGGPGNPTGTVASGCAPKLDPPQGNYGAPSAHWGYCDPNAPNCDKCTEPDCACRSSNNMCWRCITEDDCTSSEAQDTTTSTSGCAAAST
jgi:hypothetical protein